MTYTLNLKTFTDSIGDRDLEQICRDNPGLRFETDRHGKLIVMSRSAFAQRVQSTRPLWGQGRMPRVVFDDWQC